MDKECGVVIIEHERCGVVVCLDCLDCLDSRATTGTLQD